MEFMNKPTAQPLRFPVESDEPDDLQKIADQIITEVIQVPLTPQAREKLGKAITVALHSKCEVHEIREILSPDGNVETSSYLLQRLILGWDLEDLRWLAHEVPNRFFLFCLHGMQAGLNLTDTKKCLEFAIKHAPMLGKTNLTAVADKTDYFE